MDVIQCIQLHAVVYIVFVLCLKSSVSVLGINPDQKLTKQDYRKKVMELHPDRLAAKFQALKDAYEWYKAHVLTATGEQDVYDYEDA